MNSETIFDYSNSFLNEIIDDLIRLKIKKKSNPKSTDFENKLKSILGKNFIYSYLDELTNCSDKDLRMSLNKKFQDSREERIKLLGKDQSQDIEKRIFFAGVCDYFSFIFMIFSIKYFMFNILFL